MNMIPQILRLVHSDLDRSRWYIAALFVACCVNVAIVVSAAGKSSEEIGGALWSTFSSFGVILVATLLVVGSVIQNDSPSDDMAFWRAVPISPLALVISKTITLAIAIVLPLVITEAAAWSLLPIAAPDAIAASLKALKNMTAFLLFPATVAALTPSFRSYILSTILLIAASTMLASASFVVSGNRQMSAVSWFGTLQTVMTLLLVAWFVRLYFTRDSAARKRVLSAAVVLCCSYAPLSVFLLGQQFQSPSHQTLTDTTEHHFDARFSGQDVFVTFDIPAPMPSQRASVVAPKAELVVSNRSINLMPNGASNVNGTVNGVPQPRREFIPLVGGGNVMVDSTSAPKIGRVTLQFLIPSGVDAPRVFDGPFEVKFSGFLETESLDTLLNIPADTGHAMSFRGWTLQTSLRARPDSGRIFQIDGSGATPNPKFDPQLLTAGWAYFADANELRPQGAFVPANNGVTFKLFSPMSRDSVTLSSSGGSSISLQLPINPSGFAKSSHTYLVEGKPAGEASILDMQNARFLITRWKYAHHAPIGATIRVH